MASAICRGAFAERARPGHCQVGSYVAVFHVGRDLHNKSGAARPAAARRKPWPPPRRFPAGRGRFPARPARGVVMVEFITFLRVLWGQDSGASGSCSTWMSTRLRLIKFSPPEIQRVAELQPPAFGPELGRDLVGRHAQRDRAEPGLVMADMPHAFSITSWLGALPKRVITTSRASVAQLDRRRAARIAGGLGLGGRRCNTRRCAGQTCRRVISSTLSPLPVLFHRALDGDEIFFLHGRHLC